MFKCSQKGQLSLEFMFCLVLLLIIVSLFVSVNLFFKEKLDTNINYTGFNTKLCSLKYNKLQSSNGFFINDVCKSYYFNNDINNVKENQS
ncbi:MAG TPA: hypothetical protein PLN85_02445 [archaeon]|nr:hypothetical protein [archaeon]